MRSLRPSLLLFTLAGCAGPPPPDHFAAAHFELCVGADLSRLCCLDALDECLDPVDPYGVHERPGEREPCDEAYLACDESVFKGPASAPR